MAYGIDALLNATTPDTTVFAQANEFLAAFAAMEAGTAELSQLILGVYHAHAAEVPAFATLAARHPEYPTAGYFLDLALHVVNRREPLLACAGALGWSEENLRNEQAPDGMRAYGDFMTWLAMRAGPAEAACTLRAEQLLWCSAASALAEVLRGLKHQLPDPVTQYFAAVPAVPDRFLRGAREAAAFGLAHGESPAMIEHTVTQVEPLLTDFWSAALQVAG
ncbi:hypothetical protein ACFWIB_40185 [Streptomyces sp. NPDC127051]|uniref:hypothetical protein n=1 Tax=Streptomyces sp. NPDC127051 TaxID=3347119 RepID=UPI00365D7E09